MTVQLYARPYDTSAVGFYFETYEEFVQKAAKLRNEYGDPVEEFDIQFIDGENIDCELAKAIGINQANLEQFCDVVEDWDDEEKTIIILAVGECGYRFEENTQPDDFELDIYPVDTFRGLAEEFVDEGLFGDIPDRFSCYIDYDAIARDLSVDYCETTVAGKGFIYRCG